jgi:hypothetical protein
MYGIHMYVFLIVYYFSLRAEKHKRATEAAREGIFSGLVEGGGSLIYGLASGVSGLLVRFT